MHYTPAALLDMASAFKLDLLQEWLQLQYAGIRTDYILHCSDGDQLKVLRLETSSQAEGNRLYSALTIGAYWYRLNITSLHTFSTER
jgi:hypothetical protein